MGKLVDNGFRNYSPGNHSALLSVATLLGMVYIIDVLLLRVYIKRRVFGWDDYLIIASSVCIPHKIRWDGHSILDRCIDSIHYCLYHPQGWTGQSVCKCAKREARGKGISFSNFPRTWNNVCSGSSFDICRPSPVVDILQHRETLGPCHTITEPLPVA